MGTGFLDLALHLRPVGHGMPPNAYGSGSVYRNSVSEQASGGEAAMVENSSPERLIHWAKKGGLAVLDQGLFAGTNFLVGVLLARWLEPAAYGAFSAAYAVFLLVGTLHTALWTEPMLVYGSGRFQEQYATYQRLLLSGHWRFSLLCFVAFVAVGSGFIASGSWSLGVSFLGLAVAAPLNLYLWLMRRSAYVLLEPHLAAYGGAFYLVLFLGASWGLLRWGWLNEGSALLAMGLAGQASGYLIQRSVRARVEETAPVASAEVRALHWSYGRWALVAGGLSWVPGNIYFVLLPAFHGLEAAAALKALLNVVMPVLHFNGALAGLFVPAFVRAKALGRLFSTALRALWVLLVPALAYWLFLLFAGRSLMGWLYGEKYGSSGLAWLGFIAITAAVTNTFEAVLRAVERPDQVALVYAIAALASVLVGVGLVYLAGFEGAILAMTGVNVVSALLFAVLGFREGRKDARSTSHSR